MSFEKKLRHIFKQKLWKIKSFAHVYGSIGKYNKINKSEVLDHLRLQLCRYTSQNYPPPLKGQFKSFIRGKLRIKRGRLVAIAISIQIVVIQMLMRQLYSALMQKCIITKFFTIIYIEFGNAETICLHLKQNVITIPTQNHSQSLNSMN